MADYYEAPKSSNMLSHLTNSQALKDYKYENARKLVRQQEELLRNLSKVRTAMEQEETQIGKTKDYYAGSSHDKFEHTLNRADKLRYQRKRALEKEAEITSISQEQAIPPLRYTIDNKDIYGDGLGYGVGYGNGCSSGPRITIETSKTGSNIDKLKEQVETIANRYKSDTDSDEPVKFHIYEPTYYPGACYVKNMAASETGNDVCVSGAEVAQYFPNTRYVLY